MTRNLMAAGVLLAGLSVAGAQTITPGIGGVAVTGQSGAGVYLPWNGSGAVVGAPGVGSYNLSGGAYTSPYSWNQFNDPTAYNFNTGSFNYNSGVYQSGYLGNTWTNGGLTQSGYYYPTGSSYYYPAGNYYQSGRTWGNSVTSPRVYTTGRGRLRFR
jgi:hypothetical protein